MQLDHQLWVQELFHGPTLAFKDVALQLVGAMFDRVLGERGERVTIVGATSGDTGSAAIDAVAGCEHVDIVILYPRGRTSDVQRRQMTTVAQPNAHAVAVDGTFDDCQDLVKAMFNDGAFRERNRLSAVNSINWARVMAQIVYYVVAAETLATPTNGPVTFSVPTGNFGNVLAGWIAREMGAPISDFVIASNTNDILTRFVTSGDMTTRDVVPTLSPSMDIQVSSNFERLLFEMNGRDGGMTAEQLGRFRAMGRLDIEGDQRERVHRRARSGPPSFDDAATTAEIRRTQAAIGDGARPAHGHRRRRRTAVRAAGGRRDRSSSLATAHPAKFPDAVEAATGRRPELPDHLADLFDRPEVTQTWPTTSTPWSGSSNSWSVADVASNGRQSITCTVLGSSGPHPEFSVVCEFCSGDRSSGDIGRPPSPETPSLAWSLHMAARREEHPWPLRHSNNRFSNRRTRTPSWKWPRPSVSKSTPA